MPRYDYKCVDCQDEFELRQTFAEAGSGVCPSCSGIGRRVFHAVPVIYKGSGFYTTDYGRPKRQSENGAKDSKDSDSTSSSSDSAPKTKDKSATDTGASAESPKSTSDSTAKKSSSEATAST